MTGMEEVLTRYFVRLSYCGTAYHGWQSQPDNTGITVQAAVERAMSTFLRRPIALTGCGRTDTGVHARDYVAHFDADSIQELPELVYRLNRMLPPDIAIHDIVKVGGETHARYDAVSRSYEYFLHTSKSPFAIHSFYYMYGRPDVNILNQAASLLLEYTDFFPFCKAHSDVHTTICQLQQSVWEKDGEQYIYRVTANRFLRGMIRLIVGMCLNVDRGQLTLEEVQQSLESRRRLRLDWSVPPQGLFLCNIRYPGPVFGV